MTDNNRMELRISEINQIAGGYIVDGGMFDDYMIVDDQTGDVLDTAFFMFQAEEIASRIVSSNL